MKSGFKLLMLSVLLLSCGQRNDQHKLLSDAASNKKIQDVPETTEILFEVKTTDKELSPDGIIPWISIEDADKEVSNLIGKNEIVLTEQVVDVTIDYPLENATTIELRSDKKFGFTRAELILKIRAEYKRIYKEEESSAKEKTIPIEKREGLINRNATNGKYGIWGHDLEDLDLSEIIVHKKSGKKTRLELYIES
jgi:hypothetical protein